MYSTENTTAYPRISNELQALHDDLDVDEAFWEDLDRTERLETLVNDAEIARIEQDADARRVHPLFRTSLASHAVQEGSGCRWRRDLIKRRVAARKLAGEALNCCGEG